MTFKAKKMLRFTGRRYQTALDLAYQVNIYRKLCKFNISCRAVFDLQLLTDHQADYFFET